MNSIIDTLPEMDEEEDEEVRLAGLQLEYRSSNKDLLDFQL